MLNQHFYNFLKTILLISMVLGMTGCGKKGPLISPDDIPDHFPSVYPAEE